jgi:CHAD domain-containing protein
VILRDFISSQTREQFYVAYICHFVRDFNQFSVGKCVKQSCGGVMEKLRIDPPVTQTQTVTNLLWQAFDYYNQLLEPATLGDAHSIHELRRTIKKIRAFIQLLPAKFYCEGKKFDKSLSNISDLFSGLRNAQAALDLFRTIAMSEEAPGRQRAWLTLGQQLALTAETTRLPPTSKIKSASRNVISAGSVLKQALSSKLNIERGIKCRLGKLKRLWWATHRSNNSTKWHHLRRKLIRVHLQHRNFTSLHSDAAKHQDALFDLLRKDLGSHHDIEICFEIIKASCDGELADSEFKDVLKKRQKRLLRRANLNFKKLFAKRVKRATSERPFQHYSLNTHRLRQNHQQ